MCTGHHKMTSKETEPFIYWGKQEVNCSWGGGGGGIYPNGAKVPEG